MKRKIIVSFLLAIVMICVCVVPSMDVVAEKNVFLLNTSNLPGTVHPDGSYQFSEKELKRLNQYIEENTTAYDLVEMIKYVAPDLYDNLSIIAKNSLSEAYTEVISNNSRASACHGYAEIGGCTTRISVYGSSVKGVSTIKRTTMTGVPAKYDGYSVVNEIINDSDYRVGYSVNFSYEANVSATTIIDPPSDNYYSQGMFQIPYNCPTCFQWTRIADTALHGPISYVNPYE